LPTVCLVFWQHLRKVTRHVLQNQTQYVVMQLRFQSANKLLMGIFLVARNKLLSCSCCFSV